MMARKTDRRRDRRNEPPPPPKPTLAQAWRRTEVRVSSGLVAATGLIFLVANLTLLSSNSSSILYLPVVLVVLDALSSWIILTGNRPLRTPALVVVVLNALVLMVTLLGNGPLWFRILSGVLAAASVYALVILNTKPIRVHFGLDTED
ncbi:MAG TPA: hypothetical protein VHF06_26410 [Pseudonocardiaceae bacterium]|jgi:hypothetical protein|nr:hypothetical protein [Pseudonocardiaceae bacterium]